MRNLLIVLLGWLPLLAGAVDFDDATRQLPLGRLMQVYEDRDGSASIAQVSAPLHPPYPVIDRVVARGGSQIDTVLVCLNANTHHMSIVILLKAIARNGGVCGQCCAQLCKVAGGGRVYAA